MRLPRRWLTVGVLGLAFAVALEWARAAAPGPLPFFEVLDTGGLRVSSPTLAREGTWVLVYARDNCVGCDAVLSAFRSPSLTTRSVRLVVVVEGSPEAAAARAAEFSDLTGATWYADSEGQAFDGLALTGAPAVLAMREGRVEWLLGGVPTAPRLLETALAAWLER